nr:hypothetical protein [Tanacetum cinerariifolium]
MDVEKDQGLIIKDWESVMIEGLRFNAWDAPLKVLEASLLAINRMRIGQYFLMTDYSLWEVILNGDSPPPIRVIEGGVQPVAPTTAE